MATIFFTRHENWSNWKIIEEFSYLRSKFQKNKKKKGKITCVRNNFFSRCENWSNWKIIEEFSYLRSKFQKNKKKKGKITCVRNNFFSRCENWSNWKIIEEFSYLRSKLHRKEKLFKCENSDRIRNFWRISLFKIENRIKKKKRKKEKLHALETIFFRGVKTDRTEKLLKNFLI